MSSPNQFAQQHTTAHLAKQKDIFDWDLKARPVLDAMDAAEDAGDMDTYRALRAQFKALGPDPRYSR